METLSALDSAFLLLEDEHSHLHIGSVAVFEGPPPTFAEVRAAIERKLTLVPRYRQRLVTVPGHLCRPAWADDPCFELDFHVRRAGLPPGGDAAALEELAGHLMSMPLDHQRPLWESWFVDGLENGRWALVTKVHHSMVDGIAGTDLLTTMLDKTAEPDDVPEDDFQPAPLPSRTQVLATAARGWLAGPHLDTWGTWGRLAHPRTLAHQASDAAHGIAGFAAALRPVSHSSLVGEVGPRRLHRWAEVSIDDLALIRDAYGGTLNDVVVAAVSSAFHHLLVSRDERPGQHTVRTLVPVSVRRPHQRGQWDNRVSAILLGLPVHLSDPEEVLREVSRRMDHLKRSHEAEVGEVVTRIADLVPGPGLPAFLRLAFRFPQRFLTTVTTNVPGPRTELHLAGRRLLATYPYVPVADRLRVGIAVTSYDGRLFFGITADADSTPDVDVLRDGLIEAFDELVQLAKSATVSV
jgi:diacylglycerol O-acyltransferase